MKKNQNIGYLLLILLFGSVVCSCEKEENDESRSGAINYVGIESTETSFTFYPDSTFKFTTIGYDEDGLWSEGFTGSYSYDTESSDSCLLTFEKVFENETEIPLQPTTIRAYTFENILAFYAMKDYDCLHFWKSTCFILQKENAQLFPAPKLNDLIEKTWCVYDVRNAEEDYIEFTLHSNYTTSITINGRPETTTYSYNEKSGLITMPPQYLGKYFIRTICGNKLIANYWEYYPEYGDDYPEEEESYWGAIFTKK